MTAKVGNSYSESIGGFLLAWFFFMLLISGLSWLLHLNISTFTAPLAFLFAGGFTYTFLSRGKGFLWTILTSLALFVATALATSMIYDPHMDSNAYHNDNIIMLAQGWNPVTEKAWNGMIWSQHYAKGDEIMKAAVLAITGNLESTKCINLMFASAAAALVWHALPISKLWRAAIVVMTIGNPVVITQLTTSYNDYLLWLETAIIAVSCFMIWQHPAKLLPYLLMGMTLAIGINTKFTHAFYLGIECMIFAAWCVCCKKYSILRPGVTIVTVALIAGVFIIGYNPYVTNTLGYGNPVYPLIGGNEDIMTGNTPEMFQTGNRVENFIKSILSVGNVEWGLLKGGFDGEDIMWSYVHDARVNGFGIFMFAMLISGMILMALNRASRQWWIAWIVIAAAGFSFEQTWWARYIPFEWALVIIPVLNFAFTPGSNRLRKILAGAIVGCSLANSVIAVVSVIRMQCSYSFYMHYIINAQKACGKPMKVANANITLRQIFEEQGVTYQETSIEELSNNPDRIFLIIPMGTESMVAELPREDYPRVYAKPRSLTERTRCFYKQQCDPQELLIKN